MQSKHVSFHFGLLDLQKKKEETAICKEMENKAI